MNHHSETSLHREQTSRTHNVASLPAIEAEAAALLATNEALMSLAAKLEAHLDAAIAVAVSMRTHLEQEQPHDILNRRDVPGLSLRNWPKDLRPWILEFVSWKLGAQVTSEFKLFQAGRPLTDVVRGDSVVIQRELGNLKARAIRGW